MRRIMFIATVVTFAQAGVGFSTPPPQTPRATTLRRIQVNAKTITHLPSGKKYVVDLTQRGVKYEFDPKGGQIDFARLTVRTSKGEVTLKSYMETKFPINSLTDRLAGFKYSSQSFTLGNQLPVPPQNTPTVTGVYHCSGNTCICPTETDCRDMAEKVLCVDWLCVYIREDLVCSCSKV